MATPTNATTFNLTEAPVKEGIANPALMKRVYDEYNKLNEGVKEEACLGDMPRANVPTYFQK